MCAQSYVPPCIVKSVAVPPTLQVKVFGVTDVFGNSK